MKKSVLAELLGDVCSILRKQQDMVRDLQAANDIMKTDLIDCQSSTIKLQNEILLCKSEQFQSIKKAVKCTVQRTVQSELKSCSSVVADNLQSPTIAPGTLKKVVQSVAEEEDRGKNLVVFGLEEQTGEDLTSRMDSVFQALGEKPQYEVVRIGKKGSR